MAEDEPSYSIEFRNNSHYCYNRNRHNAQTLLSQRIASLYSVSNCELFCSGMNAIYLTLDTLAKVYSELLDHPVFYVSNKIYGEVSYKIIPHLKKKYPNIKFLVVDIYSKDWKGVDFDVLYFESCSNPDGYIFDYDLLKTMKAKNRNSTIVIDNTWLSPIVFNPFDYGADIVIDSCSKYMSEAKCIMGSICFSNRSKVVQKKIIHEKNTMGIHVSVPYCEIVLKSLNTLDKRISKSYENVSYVLDLLREIDKVPIANHPLVHSPIACSKYFKCGPSVINFYVSKPGQNWKSYRNDIGRIVARHGIHYVTSFGHDHHSIDSYPMKDDDGVWIRLYIGWMSTETLCTKLKKIISEI